MNYKMIISDIQAAILAFVGLLLALIIGAACGLLLLAFHNRIIKVFAGGEANGSLKLIEVTPWNPFSFMDLFPVVR